MDRPSQHRAYLCCLAETKLLEGGEQSGPGLWPRETQAYSYLTNALNM
jgi:hypothetical protein